MTAPTPFDAAIAAAVRSTQTVAGQPAVYRRGAVAVDLVAVRGRSTYDADTAAGKSARRANVDWIIAAADLVLAASRTKPARGDTLTVDGVTFRVVNGRGDTPWEYHGNADYLRVHTIAT